MAADRTPVDLSTYPMGRLLQEIDGGLRSGLFMLSIAGTLMIPDIVGGLSAPDGRATGKRFVQWYDSNLPNAFMNGEEVYALRCSLLHQAKQAHAKLGWDRVIWTSPKLSSSVMHECIDLLSNGEKVLYLHAERFCSNIIVAYLNWYEKFGAADEVVQKNLAGLLADIEGVSGFGLPFRGIT